MNPTHFASIDEENLSFDKYKKAASPSARANHSVAILHTIVAAVPSARLAPRRQMSESVDIAIQPIALTRAIAEPTASKSANNPAIRYNRTTAAIEKRIPLTK